MLGTAMTGSLLLLVAAGVGPADPGAPPVAAPAPPPRAAPTAAPPPAPPPMPFAPAESPFRLGLTYTHVLHEDGDLADDNLTTNAVGIDMVFPSSTYGRSHLGLAHQWEHAGPYSARGFRLDVISIGYPIRLAGGRGRDRLELEPVLTIARAEIMFVTDGPKFLRLESGFALEMAATIRQWFFSVQALAIDFRYWVYSSMEPQSVTGFARIFPLRLAVGHEF